jgi:hypothetical protein
MPKPQLDVGPWKKGLVEAESPWDIPDNAVQELINFDVMDDGMLRARRGFKRAVDTNNWLDAQGAISGNQPIMCNIFGDYEGSSSRYCFASSAGAVNGGKWLYTRDPAVEGWSLITDTISSGEVYMSSVIYQNFVYVPATTYSGVGFGGGLKFNKSGIGANLLGVTAANLPKGEESYMIKDRMFVISYDESKIYWSKATDPVTWTAPDGGFVLVNPNDGSTGITSCVLLRDTLYIFKETGIWQFSFNSDPAIDGYLQRISYGLGGMAATDGQNIYFANDLGCYQLINASPVLLSEELNWRNMLTTSAFVRTRDYRVIALPGQLIVLWGFGQEGACMNTITGAWSRYYFGTAFPSQMVGGHNTRRCRNGNGPIYYLTSKFFSANIYYFRQDWQSPYDYLDDKLARIPRYRLKTKYLTLGERLTWKKLKRTWIDSYMETPSSAGGVNLVVGLNTNNGLSNELRLNSVEATPGPLADRYLKFLGGRRFLSLAYTVDSSSANNYFPATGTKDTLTANFPYWFIRKFVSDIATGRLQDT